MGRVFRGVVPEGSLGRCLGKTSQLVLVKRTNTVACVAVRSSVRRSGGLYASDPESHLYVPSEATPRSLP